MKHHIGETNKMSDTPRTDARRGFHGWYTAVDAEFSEKLERELNAANDRIKRMEEALTSIGEYCNRQSKERAMEDACWHKWVKP